MSIRTILVTCFISLILFPSISMASCKGFWGCTFNIAGKVVKTAVKTVTKPVVIGIGAVTGIAEGISAGESAGGVILSGLEGAGEKVVDSITGTVKDVGEMGEAVYDAAKASSD